MKHSTNIWIKNFEQKYKENIEKMGGKKKLKSIRVYLRIFFKIVLKKQFLRTIFKNNFMIFLKTKICLGN